MARRRPAGSTAARGYSGAHVRLRAQAAKVVASGQARCWRCQEPILPGEPWDLGHVDGDKSRYAGPEHSACSRSAGGRLGGRARRRGPHDDPDPEIRSWW
jgi:hypothetical protein